MNIIDRRRNPQGKSLVNRQRFMERAKDQIREGVHRSASERKVADIESGGNVKISADGLSEPSFRRAATGGVRDHVVPGNKNFQRGDEIYRPPGGGRGRGNEGSESGEGEDDFRFILSRDEFLDIFLEDLELPDMVKQKEQEVESDTVQRAGFSPSGSPANLNLVRTMRNAMGRRIALKRPKAHEMDALRERIAALEEDVRAGRADIEALQELRAELERMGARCRSIPWMDPVDVRYNRFKKVPKPAKNAVMFCLMDVSGSMTEHLKDLAKRFFMLLFLFLRRRYKKVDVVFIRHTHEATEVDEDTFFYGTETGGTIVSTALEEMMKIIMDRYPAEEWNIYGAYASDGDNLHSDNPQVARLMSEKVLPVCQYFTYVETCQPIKMRAADHKTDLWRTFEVVLRKGSPFAMARVAHRTDVFTVFKKLFSKERSKEAA